MTDDWRYIEKSADENVIVLSIERLFDFEKKNCLENGLSNFTNGITPGYYYFFTFNQ